jgi:hypothetical protein
MKETITVKDLKDFLEQNDISDDFEIYTQMGDDGDVCEITFDLIGIYKDHITLG